MTTSVREQTIQPSWPVDKIQHANAQSVASHIVAKLKLADEQPESAIKKYQAESAAIVASQMKQCGVKTPLDLVRQMAEHEANLFGAQVAIEGNDAHACLINKNSTVWEAVKEMIDLTPEQAAKAQQRWRDWMSDLAGEFGFRSDIQISRDNHSAKISFTRQGS